MSAESTSSQIADDVRMIVSGNFTKDALGPLYDQVRLRARAKPADYLRVFESLFLARPLNARAQSSLHLPFLLEMLGDLDPAKVRQIASSLLAQYDNAMSVADSLAEEDGTLEALPKRTGSLAKRLSRRRDALRRLAQKSGRG